MNTTTRVLSIVFCFFLFLTVPVPDIFAQVKEEDVAAGFENCFMYYDYGNVAVNLATDKPLYTPGTTAQIFGTIVNENTFPLVDVVVYAQLRRTNTLNQANEGHYLIERKIISQPMNLLPKETRSITASFPLRSQYPAGSYQLQYFIFSQKGFHYAGRPFLEEDYAGISLFDIQNSATPLVFIDPSSLKINGEPAVIRGPTKEFSDETLRFSATISDARAEKSAIPVTVTYYSFEDTLESYRVFSETVTASAANGLVESTFRPPASGAYVMVMRTESPTVSELKYRFAKTGGKNHTLRINDLGVTSYPPTKSDRAYVCMHSPAPAATPLTTVTLRVLDSSKKILYQKTGAKAFLGEVLALSVPFESDASNRDFWVQAEMKWKTETGEEKTQTSDVHYSCDTFQASPKDLTLSFASASSSLEIGTVNTCDAPVRTGGFIESIRILNKSGEIVQEMYNVESAEKSIDVASLPAGNYTARVRSGEFDKTVDFLIAGSASRTVKGATYWRMIRYLLLLLALAAGTVWYIKRKHKKI